MNISMLSLKVTAVPSLNENSALANNLLSVLSGNFMLSDLLHNPKSITPAGHPYPPPLPGPKISMDPVACRVTSLLRTGNPFHVIEIGVRFNNLRSRCAILYGPNMNVLKPTGFRVLVKGPCIQRQMIRFRRNNT